jgi:hypothetical protein
VPRRAGGTARDPRAGQVGGYLSEAVLPIYVLHQPVLVALAFAVLSWPVHPVLKYLAIGLGTLVAVVAAYELLIRRTRPTRLLFGVRAGRRPRRSRRNALLPRRAGTAYADQPDGAGVDRRPPLRPVRKARSRSAL